MKLKNMLGEMSFCGEVVAPKRTYVVFKNRIGYVLCSQKSRNIWEGDFVIVKEKAVEYLAHRLKGQMRLTSTMVRDRTRTPQFVKDRFDVLNGLYVLIALGRAKIDTRFRQRATYFNVYG